MMKTKKSIEQLLHELYSGELSVDESIYLAHLFSSEKPGDELKKFYSEHWEAVTSTGNMPNSDVRLKKIHSLIQQKEPNVNRVNPTYIALIKYAAIIILAFATGFLSRQIYHHSTDNHYSEEVFMNEISVEYGSKSQILLSDGTKVKLNSGSKLIYPSKFDGNMRLVQLKGEAFFEVAKDETRPFFVNTHCISIRVLGTSFNLKSYPEENFIETTLVSGAIEIYNELASNLAEITKPPIAVLKPNDKVTFVKDINAIKESAGLLMPGNIPVQQRSAGVLVESKVETALFVGWKDNVLRFKGERFEDIVIKLERWYDVKIEINHNTLPEERFTGQFDTETIEQALEALRLTTPFRYTISKNEIVIYSR